MTKQEIKKHREKYPLPFAELSRYSSFEQILRRNNKEYTLSERKQRWDKVMSFSKDMKDYWNDNEGCVGCRHLGEDNWCMAVGLPCSVNPFISFKRGIIGLACLGVGFENKQIKMDF